MTRMSYDADFLYISSSLIVCLLSFFLEILTANKITWFFDMDYLQNSLTFWPYFCWTTVK